MIVILTVNELVKHKQPVDLKIIASLPYTELLISKPKIIQNIKLRYDLNMQYWLVSLYGSASKRPFKELDNAIQYISDTFDSIEYN